MQLSKITTIVIAATIALIALAYIQTKWMMQSHHYIEEQFNNKVSMALCMAVDHLNEIEGGSAAALNTCGKEVNVFEENIGPFYVQDIALLDKTLKDALAYYDLDLEYELSIIDQQCIGEDEQPAYCCALSPIVKSNNKLMTLDFPGKTNYILREMGFMLCASILILLFTATTLIFATSMFIRQKRITERNIEFFNNMAHEFRTPLANISLATGLLKRKHPKLKEDKYTAILTAESKQMTEQVEHLLQYAKVEHGRFELSKAKINLHQLLHKVVGDMQIQLNASDASIEWHLSDENLQINADEFHLSRVIRNLIDNAIKYNKSKPIISIHTELVDQGVNISVADNGIGIALNDQANIFNKYNRGQSPTCQAKKGFGLGLSYAKSILESHKGFIKLISELGKGTRFDLFLPLTEQNKQVT